MTCRRTLLASVAAAALAAGSFSATPTVLRAGDVAGVDKNVTRNLGKEEPVPLNLLETNLSYVGEASFKTKQFDGAGPLNSARSYGRQDEFHESISAARRIPLGAFDNRLFLKLGASYERFDFGKTFAPVPTSLQSATGVIGVEYIVQGRPAIYFETKPGVFFSDFNDVTTGSFDSPTVLAATFPITKSIFGIVGVRGSLLSHYPVIPIGGFVWVFSEKLRLEAVPPEPRLIYSVSKQLDFFVGGDLLGDSYRRDRNNAAKRPLDRQFNNAVVEYNEYRVGAGVTLTPFNGLDIDISGGYVPQREFYYYRTDSDKRFRTHGAPYAKIAIKAEF